MTDDYYSKQFKRIEATIKNAKIEIESLREEAELLREENDRLSEMVEFLLKKSGDIHAEQTA